MSARRLPAALALLGLVLPGVPVVAKDKKVDATFLDRVVAGEDMYDRSAFPPPTPEEARQLPFQDHDEDASAVVNDIIDHLVAANPTILDGHRRPEFVLLADDRTTCFTVRSASKIACSGDLLGEMLRIDGGREMFRFVIAHEMAHVAIKSHRARFVRQDKMHNTWMTLGIIGGLAANMALAKYSKTGNTINVTTTAAGGRRSGPGSSTAATPATSRKAWWRRNGRATTSRKRISSPSI